MSVVVRNVASSSATCTQVRSWNLGLGCHRGSSVAVTRPVSSRRWSNGRRVVAPRPSGRLVLSDVLEVFARLEPNRPARRNADFLARPGVPADAPLTRLDLKDAKPAKLDALAPLHGGPHRIEDRVNR